VSQEKTSMAVLFADVSDSTRLYESMGDTIAFGKVREVIGLLKNVTAAYNGRVVKTIGDGLMCAFVTADAAANAAGEMHRQIAQREGEVPGKKLTIRIGFHYGQVIQDGDDVFGDSVNIAARMAGLALAGQAVTTSDTVAALSPAFHDTVRHLSALPVKGKSEEIEVHELLWQPSIERTLIPGKMAALQFAAAAEVTGPRIKLTYRGRDVIRSDTVFLGRDASNTLFIMDPMASRRHGKIELRGGKFVLMDQSSNGTFVTIGESSEIRLRREEIILYSTGKIAFGHSASDPEAEVVKFNCDIK
jgi:adenylate cyclase